MKKSLFFIRSSQFFAYGQIIFGISIFGCLVIIPHYFFSLNQGGISNYGTQPSTEWLFITGFTSAVIGSLLSAITIVDGTKFQRSLRIGLSLLAVMYALVLFSTFSYKVSSSFRQLHQNTSAVLFSTMVIGAIWIRFRAVNDTNIKRAFLLFSISILVGAATISGVLHFLFAAEIISGSTFGYMLSHSLALLEPPNKGPHLSKNYSLPTHK